jgi:putative phage-type endonuclease
MIKDKDWYDRRQHGIGGSDAAAVLGVSPFKSPLRLWMEKRGEIEPDQIDDKPAVYWGTVLERVVAEEYERRTNRRTIETNSVSVHPRLGWMICNVDRFVDYHGPRLILEIKCTGMYAFNASNWGPDGSAQVPPYYYTQAQHNIAVTESAQCDMPVLIGGNDYRCYSIPRDSAFISALIDKERAFVQSIRAGIKPPPINLEDLRILFPSHQPGAHVDADETTAEAWAKLANIKICINRMKSESRELEFKIKGAMGSAEYLSFNGVKLASWRAGSDGKRRFRVVTSGVESDGEASEAE